MSRLVRKVVGLLVVVVALLLAAGCTSSSPPPGRPAAEAEGAVPVGPRREVNGVPRGWRHDEVGARTAAVAYVGLSGEVARAGFIVRRDMVVAMATPEFAPRLEAETTAQLSTVSDDLTEAGVPMAEVVWSEVPLTARTVELGAARAEVEVWSVTVMGLPEVDAVPRQSWRTVTVEMAWVGRDWRVSGWEARSGPTPALGPAPSIGTVEDVAEVAGWPAAWEVTG